MGLFFPVCLMFSIHSSLRAESEGKSERPLPASPLDVRPALVGTEAPGAILKTSDGRDFDLKGAISEKPTVLIFYRGWW